MTGAQALAYFVLEVSRASGQVGLLTVPKVEPIHYHERHPGSVPTVIAYVEPGRRSIKIMWHALWGLNKKQLRCVARHEVTHIRLGHGEGARDLTQREEYEEAVRVFMKDRWGEDSHCDLE